MNKIIRILIITLLLSVCLYNQIYALDNIIDGGTKWTSDGDAAASTNPGMNTDNLKKASTEVFNIFFDIGIGVIIIVGAFLGIKYMTAGIEEKVEVKKTLIPFLISSVVLAGAYGIWKLAVVILKDLV